MDVRVVIIVHFCSSNFNIIIWYFFVKRNHYNFYIFWRAPIVQYIGKTIYFVYRVLQFMILLTLRGENMW